jgi:hypothetical protein
MCHDYVVMENCTESFVISISSRVSLPWRFLDCYPEILMIYPEQLSSSWNLVHPVASVLVD